ncbi:penicillin-binding protein 2 [Siculibacillus lacustris]|uniref:Penicillin-binding protein 2 n=1 Tax=Siculibacillus lacustris TaxID=1549641 RepID=A0A4Q9VS79_9HYPH|nr:penicillin-binding protein 2 [Siculibacillus lacustris]
MLVAGLGFAGIYAAIVLRLIGLGMASDDHTAALDSARAQISTARPDIVDRNGEVLATDVKSSSLYAEPKRILDVDEAVEALASVIPEMRGDDSVRRKLASKTGFVWLRRELKPEQRAKIFRLGIPGIGFMDENRRFYPGGATAGHVLGTVNVDNQGISGIEKTIDQDMGLVELRNLGIVPDRGIEPRRLSIDLRVQHVVRDEMLEAMARFRAVAAVGIVLDVRTGEVVAMTSVPDFDPNHPEQALEKQNMNRATAGVYEMGSVFKTFNSGLALDSGKVKLTDTFDVTPLQFGSQRIGEFHSKGHPLSVTEIFLYSSNNGSARMALRVGSQAQRAFFERLGLLKRIDTELPEVAAPLVPKGLSDVSTATMAFGHGISVTPMHTAIAGAAMINGGRLMPPTFFPRTPEEADRLAVQVIRPETSDKMRYLFLQNATSGTGGSGSKAAVPGYRVGGKTGTAEKIEHGHYNAGKRFNSFLAAFPMDDPRYLVLTVLDEPKAEAGGEGPATAGLNAASAAGGIIRRIAPMLGVMPRYDQPRPAVASN